jgi:hypothetical protein
MNIIQAEIEQMNKLIIHLLDMDTFIVNVKEGLEQEAENDPYNFADVDGDVSVDEGDIDRHIEREWESKYPDFDVPTAVYEVVHEHFNGNTFIHDLEISIKEVVEDEMAYQRDPLKYVGMSERDFL